MVEVGVPVGKSPKYYDHRPPCTIPLCMVATVTRHAGLVALLIYNLVTHHAGLVANCHVHFPALPGYNIRNFLI